MHRLHLHDIAISCQRYSIDNMSQQLQFARSTRDISLCSVVIADGISPHFLVEVLLPDCVMQDAVGAKVIRVWTPCHETK